MSTAEKLTRPGYLSKSIGLMSTAARAAGVDLGAAMKKGDITAVDYATMVHRCNSSNRQCAFWRRLPTLSPAR